MATDGLLGERYRLEHVAGHGGMATVFVAYDTVLQRTVALKLLQHRRDASGVLQERFRREALAEARIVHPNVVAVHDVGVHEGRPYIVMDYVEGESLAGLIAQGPLPGERVAAIGLGIARALAAAHELGIVHRDVKPQNVLIDPQGLPHLTDFGLARIDDGAADDLTNPGEMVGTALYVAPEQARYGTSEAAADLYSLGAVLYHAVAGAPPFEATGGTDVALRRYEEDPVPLTARVPDVDPELAGLIQTLLARNAPARPASAAAVAERLGDIAARLRTERNAGETPPPPAVPVAAAAATATACVPGAVADVPLPNSSPLPAEPLTPVAEDAPG